MPKKLEDCITKIMATGKTREEAIPICVKSTGLKMAEEKPIIEHEHIFMNGIAEFWQNS